MFLGGHGQTGVWGLWFRFVDAPTILLPLQKLLIYQSVNPSAGAAAIFFVFVIGRTKIAVLVKIIFGVLVVLLHVNLEFLSSATALPAMVTILEAIASL
jgi:hypothetical protein